MDRSPTVIPAIIELLFEERKKIVTVETRHLSNFVNSFLCCRITFSHKNAQLFHKVGAVTVRTKLSGEPRLASAARYLFSS
jgi:hypothetical protein